MDSVEAITVWLIEDDPTYRRTVTRALGRMPGIRCSAFPSFEDARTHLRRGELPEVVLLDVGLPGIDGLQALGELREHSPAPRVIVLTVFEDDDKIFDGRVSRSLGLSSQICEDRRNRGCHPPGEGWRITNDPQRGEAGPRPVR